MIPKSQRKYLKHYLQGYARDTVQSGHYNFGTPYAAGTFHWPIPWLFRVAGGASKEFAVTHHRMTIGAAGGMTVSKAGATGSAALADAKFQLLSLEAEWA